MKTKLTLILFCFCAFAMSQAPGTPTIVTDTVHYYFNKYFFKSGQLDLTKMPYYKNYTSGAVASGTNVTHIGNVFENPDSIIITGAEAFLCFHKSGQLSVSMHFYLCTVDNNDMPVIPPVDSFAAVISSTLPVIWGVISASNIKWPANTPFVSAI